MTKKLQRAEQAKQRKIVRALRALAAAHGFEIVRVQLPVHDAPGQVVGHMMMTRPAADPRQVDLPHHVRRCLRHDECDLADEIARRSGRHAADHCHDLGCEQCGMREANRG